MKQHPYMYDGTDLFQKWMSEPERHVSFIELAWRYHPLKFIHNSVKYTEVLKILTLKSLELVHQIFPRLWAIEADLPLSNND